MGTNPTPPTTPFTPESSAPHNVHGGGERHVYKFPNGYSASVIRTLFSYGGEQGLWELAVLNSDGKVDYTTPITCDVEGYLTDESVAELLARISELEAKP